MPNPPTNNNNNNNSSMSGGMASGMMRMSEMVFHTGHSTPLYSRVWTPSSPGAYAATCLFLVALAIISRLLSAYRYLLEARWRERALNSRYIAVGGGGGAVLGPRAERREKRLDSSDGEDVVASSASTTAVDGVAAQVTPPSMRPRGAVRKPWRFSTDLPRASIFTLEACVRYFLMFAVMTLNTGYFLSVLAGLFVGELAIGRYASFDDTHH